MENCLKHVDFFIVLKMTHLIQAWVIFIFTMNKLTYRIEYLGATDLLYARTQEKGGISGVLPPWPFKRG